MPQCFTHSQLAVQLAFPQALLTIHHDLLHLLVLDYFYALLEVLIGNIKPSLDPLSKLDPPLLFFQFPLLPWTRSFPTRPRRTCILELFISKDLLDCCASSHLELLLELVNNVHFMLRSVSMCSTVLCIIRLLIAGDISVSGMLLRCEAACRRHQRQVRRAHLRRPQDL